ncbi:MAG: S41 family peptidase [Prolixibacteraceae bacterium]|nr:S41 family peptidase [Prolixibacteraceae bacterium]
MKFFVKGAFVILFIFSVLFVNGQNEQSLKFNRLLRLVESYYVDTVNIEKLTEVAIISLLAELDPHSVYISKEDVEKMNEPLKGSFEGIGISFNILRDTLMVLQTIPGGPSEKVGLVAGDRILYVDDELIAGIGITNQDVFDRLRGEKGTLVVLKILRKGEKDLLEFEIIRDEIPIYSLDASYMLNETTGYLKLNRFSATTTDEFVEAVKNLKDKHNLKNLILDLRGNGGGYLKSAHEISDQFLPYGRMIVYTEGTNSPKKDYLSTTEGVFEQGRLAVLIDGSSASASEIVSGAVQDWDRGIILGRRSFGKGLVQQPYLLTDGSMIRLTTAHYYTPSGRCIQKPYENGMDDYREDMLGRIERGELFNKDSISVVDSLKYKTLINRRVVYGGGGIIPDVFIPLDTASYYRYYNQLIRKSVVNQFVINYVDAHRNELEESYPDFRTFKEKFRVSNQMLEDLWAEGVKKDIERDEESIEMLPVYAKRHLKAIIARDLWNSSEYYEIINADDDEILKALEILENTDEYNSILRSNQ